MHRPFSVLLLCALIEACAVPLPSNGPIGLTVANRPLRTESSQVAGFVRELRPLLVKLPDGTGVILEALVTRPAEPGRYPLILLSHGTPRGGEDARTSMTPSAYTAQSFAFARRGYAVAVVMRRGYGRSEGTNAESSGPCSNRDYSRAGHASAADLLGSLETLRREDWVDPARIVLVGQSAGGFASLAAAASGAPGMVGVISFAGGRGSDAPGHVCQPERLVEAMGELGQHVKVPALWIYADNDQFFDPALARQMAAAYSAGGAPLQMVAAPAFGDDGHSLFSTAPVEMWAQWALPFLSTLGLPTEVLRPATATELSPPGTLDAAGKTRFSEYLASESLEKAFAVGSNGWGQGLGKRTEADAIGAALALCREHSDDCALYAIGNTYAPGARAGTP